MSNLQTAPWHRLVNTAALCSETNPIRADWLKTTEHFIILGQEESICSSPQGKKCLAPHFQGSRCTLVPAYKLEWDDKPAGAANMNSYMKQTRICLSVKISGGGKWLLFIVCMSYKIRNCFKLAWHSLGLFSFHQRNTTAKRSCRCYCSHQGFVPSESRQIRLITLGMHNSFEFIVLPLCCYCLCA